MAESITNKKIISFAGKNIDLDEFIRRALARAVEWMDYQGLKGDERVDFLNSFNTRLLNIVSGQSGNSEQPSTTIAVGGEENDGTNYYGKSTGDRKEDGKPRGGLFGTSKRTGFNPELNVDTYLNGIAGTIPSVEEQNAATTQSTASTLKPFNPSTMGNYIGNEIFGEGNAPTEKLLQAWIDAHDKLGEDGKRSIDGRLDFINKKLLAYRQELLDGKYQISDEDKNKEIAKIDRLLSHDIQDWERGKLAPWMSGLLANPTVQTLNPVTLGLSTEQVTPLETVVEEATETPTKHDLFGENGEITDVDKARFYSILGDIGSAGAAFIPGYGTAASAVLGVGSTGLGAYADFNDKTVTAGEAWMNTGLGLGADVLGLFPGLGSGAKAYKVTKALAKIPWNSLIKMARTIGIGTAGIDTLELIYNKAIKGETLNSDDLKKLKTITSVGSGEARVAGAKRATKRILGQAKKIEGTTVNTSKGRKVVDDVTAEKLSKAKTKADADKILKDAAKTNPDLEGAEAVFGETRMTLTPWKKSEVNLSELGRKPGYTEPTGRVGGYLDINPERGQVYDFSNVKQRTGLFSGLSDEAIVARRVDAVNYKGRPDYKAKLNENPTTAESSTSGTKPKTTKPKGLNPKTATKAVTAVDKTGNTASLERHIKKATGVTLDKSNPNSKVNLRTAIQDLKKAGHTDEQISNMLTNKQFMEALKQQYKFKEGGLIPIYRNPAGGLITMPMWFTSFFTPESKHTTKKFKEASTTSGAEPTTTSLATSTVPASKPESKPAAKPEQPLQGTVGGNLEGIVGQTGNGSSLTVLTPTIDTNPNGGRNTPGRQIGNPTDLALTGLELGKFFGSMWANNAILNKYKQLRPYHRINPQQAYRIWSPKPLLDLAQQTKTDADNLGALMARGTNDLGQAAAYRLTSHFKGVDAARPYELQADKEIKDSVNTAISIQNDNQEKRVERVNDNHKADVAKFNQDRLAEIQRLHDNSTKLQQLATTMLNGIARGAVAKYENDYRSFLASDPEIVNARNAYRNAKARYDANPNDTKAQQELTNAQNALNNILTDKSNYWLSNHRQALGFPFGPVIWTSPIPLSTGSFFDRSSFFAKGGNLEVVDRVEKGRMKRHYDKLFYNTHKLLVTESNKKQRAMGSGFAYFHKLMMQSK